MKEHCNYWKCANRIGLFLVILYVICFAWYFINPAEQATHLQMFKFSYLGFNGMDFVSFLSGAVQTYIWAYIGLGVWQVVGCCHKSGTSKDGKCCS